MRAPLPWKWSSRLPPCCPASPFESSSPPVATPTTPTMGIAGKRMRSVILISPSRTSKIFVTGFSTKSISWPKPGMSVATPHSTGRTSRISATSESPGSAPRTATGPVALLIRERSISVTRSSSLWICPVKQSFVSKVTTSPGSTSSTGWRSGPNDQTTSLSATRCCITGLRVVLDVHVLHVGDLVRPCEGQEDRQHNTEAEPPDVHPVAVLLGIDRRVLPELVVEREEEEDDAANRQDDMQQHIGVRSPRAEGVDHRAHRDEHVDDDHGRHRHRGDREEAVQRSPLPAEEQGEPQGEDAHADDRVRRCLDPRMDVPERPRRELVPREGVEDARRRVDAGVRVRSDRVDDREEDEDPAAGPEHLPEGAPRVGVGRRLVDEVVEACSEDPRVRAEDIKEPDQHRGSHHRDRHGPAWLLRLLAERRRSLEPDEGEDREHHPLEDAAPLVGGVMWVEGLEVQPARIREDHPEGEGAEDRDLERSQDDAGRGRDADVAIREQEDEHRHDHDPDPPLAGVVPADLVLEDVAHGPAELEVEEWGDERLEEDEEPRDEEAGPRPERARGVRVHPACGREALGELPDRGRGADTCDQRKPDRQRQRLL